MADTVHNTLGITGKLPCDDLECSGNLVEGQLVSGASLIKAAACGDELLQEQVTSNDQDITALQQADAALQGQIDSNDTDIAALVVSIADLTNVVNALDIQKYQLYTAQQDTPLPGPFTANTTATELIVMNPVTVVLTEPSDITVTASTDLRLLTTGLFAQNGAAIVGHRLYLNGVQVTASASSDTITQPAGFAVEHKRDITFGVTGVIGNNVLEYRPYYNTNIGVTTEITGVSISQVDFIASWVNPQ